MTGRVEGGIFHEVIADDIEDKIHVRSWQDVAPILENNKDLAIRNGTRAKGDVQHVASIPNIIINQWLKEGIDFFNPDHLPAIIRKLNDPSYRFLRTGGGHLGTRR